MLGFLKLVTIIAASLLLFEALRGFDWASNVHDPAVLLGVDLILQGKQNVAALFDRASWFSAISENAIQIEAGVAAFGAVLLMAANRLTISGFSSKVILSSMALGLLFFFAGPGRQVVANNAAQFSDQAGAAARRSAGKPGGFDRRFSHGRIRHGTGPMVRQRNNERSAPGVYIAMLQLRECS